MIKEAFAPNTVDGIWHDSLKIAGPFGKRNKLIICIVSIFSYILFTIHLPFAI